MQSPGIGGLNYEKRLKETFIGHKKWIMELSKEKQPLIEKFNATILL